MTPQELDALQALCDGATPGEWSIQENRMMCAPVIEAGYKHEIAKVLFYRGSEDPEVFPNARFIAAARAAMPALIAEVRRLQEAYEAPPKPLTIEELDTMNNEPVFIQGGDGEEFWIIAGENWMYEIDYDPDFINMEYADPAGHFGLHVLGWRAYRRRPNA